MLFQQVQRGRKITLPQMSALRRLGPARLVPLRFHRVELADQPQHEARGHRRIGQRLVEEASGIGPAPDADNLVVLALDPRVGAVGVGWQQALDAGEERRCLLVPP